METPNARGIIIFANEDDIRWDSGTITGLLGLYLRVPPSSCTSPPYTPSWPPFPLLPAPPTFPAAASDSGAPSGKAAWSGEMPQAQTE